jgi:S-adenosylmethionine:tRNA ribosyltransferase-isomerase
LETNLFDYELPEESVAQRPLPERDASRLCVVARDGVHDRAFGDFAELVPEGSLVVLNDTRVHRARLLGARAGSGGRVEIFLLKRLESATPREETWLALGRANSPLRPGTVIQIGEVGRLSVEVLHKDEDAVLRVRLRADGGVEAAIAAEGHIPLPPYMRRADDADDGERYQTVFARHQGSVAAPTAGLHLTERVLQRLQGRGVELGYLTLHVGLGTFRPVSAADLDDHVMHEETFSVGPELADAVARARARSGPVVAVGTTVVRALESARDPGDARLVKPTSGETRLLVQPGYSFGPVDALLTNFHLPRSTLLALVSAFAGRERLLAAYAHAVAAGYRFLSYGDAMWIPERLS